MGEGKVLVPASIETHNQSIHKGKLKVLFTLEQAMKAQRGSRRIALLFLWPRR